MKLAARRLAVKGVAQLSASAIMGVLTLAQIAFLSRHFDFRDLGILSTQLLVTSIATTFCDFGWEGFIIQERGNQRRVAMILGPAMPRIIALVVAVDLIAALLFHTFAGVQAGWMALFFILPVLPFVVLVGAMQGFAVRALKIERLAMAEVGAKTLGVAATIGTGWYFDSTNCVVIGFACTMACKFLFLAAFQHRFLRLMLATCTRRARSSRLYYYMGSQLTAQVVNILGIKADELIVAGTMSLEVFGIYSSIKQLVLQGGAFIAPLIRRLSMPYFSRDRLDDTQRRDNAISIFVWSNAAYIVFFLTLAIAARLATQFALGPHFEQHAGLLIQFCVLLSLQTFAGATVSAYLQSTGAPFKALTWMLIQVGLQLLVMRGSIGFGLTRMLWCASLAYAVMGVVYHVWFFRREAALPVVKIVVRILLPVVLYYAAAGGIIAVMKALALPNLFDMGGAALFVGVAVLVTLGRRVLFPAKATSTDTSPGHGPSHSPGHSPSRTDPFIFDGRKGRES